MSPPVTILVLAGVMFVRGQALSAQGACDLCPSIHRPVCGVNGKTYDNRCLANCEGVVVDSQGKCATMKRASGASFLLGQTLVFDKRLRGQTVHWKQGSFFGWGGDRSQKFDVCDYKLGNGRVLVYVATEYRMPRTIKINSNLQYGMNNGVFFIVLHDKSQTPYQHRFIQTTAEKILYGGNKLLKGKYGVDLSWIAGDYLRTF